jgi:hypothetical protein
MLYICMADASADERGFAVLQQIQAERGEGLILRTIYSRKSQIV